MKKLALVTGATAGIGEATAEMLAAKKVDLLLTGRREGRLRAFCDRLKSENGIEATPLVFDVSSRIECEKAIAKLGSRMSELTILVNNAGLALGTDPAPQADLAHWEQMIDTNVKGLMAMTRLCLPHLIANAKAGRDAHVVNIGSVAGRWTYPGGSGYCATKFAVRGFTEALRLDLMGTGVRVTGIEPGMVETEFSLVRLQDENKAKAVYRGLEPLHARDIAESIVWCLERPRHVNIQELVVFPTDQAGVGPSYTFRR